VSDRIQYHVRKRLAAGKAGSMPVLPQALGWPGRDMPSSWLPGPRVRSSCYPRASRPNQSLQQPAEALYLVEQLPAVRNRLCQAGVRLATVLNFEQSRDAGVATARAARPSGTTRLAQPMNGASLLRPEPHGGPGP
jgi:hypothetical protein